MKNSLTNILKNKKSLVNFAAGIALSLSLANYGFAQNRSINFEKENFENIKKKAEKENKLIFMDCYTTWCGPCKAMDKNVFTNDSVADFYNKNFLNVKINMESEEGKKIGKSFHIDFYPTFLYINEKEKLIHKGVGGFSTRMFVNLGEEALNPETQLATFNEKYEKGNRDGKFIYEYLKKLGSADIDYKNIS
ncbi:MAG: thioredoxin domain-containing protein, partial [Candidatus Daviesbacteria bacterium]|nr:thioredoxin domain-containing protein [Candidatus Daviesbacteria bacterium]